MDIPSGKAIRKKLSDLLVEAGIVKPDQLPKGLEFAQKATDADVLAVRDAKLLIAEKGLDVSTAIKAISLSKQKHSTVDVSLQELGWAPKNTGDVLPERLAGQNPLPNAAPRSQFDRSQLDAIGRKSTGEVPGLSAHFGKPVTSNTGETAIPQFDSAELDAIKPEEDLARQSLRGLKAIAAAQTARVNPIAALGSTQPVSSAVPAAKRDHKELLAEADHAFGKRNYELAESLYVQALNALETKPDSTLNEVSEVLFKTGQACVHIKDFARAEQYFSRALKIRELHSGPSTAVAEVLDQLAELHEIQEQFDQAEQYCVAALNIKEKVHAGSSPEVIATLKKLVSLIKRRGLRPEEKFSGELLVEANIISGPKMTEVLSYAQQNGMPIGRALIARGLIDEPDLSSLLHAQLLLREGVIPAFMAIRALKIACASKLPLHQALHEFGVKADELITPQLAQLQQGLDKVLEAERDCGTDSPEAASLCLKLGDQFLEMNRSRSAESVYLRATTILEKNPTANRGEAVAALTKLGRLYYDMRQFSDADAVLSRLMKLFGKPEDEQDMSFATAAESLGAVKYVMGNYDESARLYEKAVVCKEQTRGPHYPGLIPTLQGRANCHFALSEFTQAEQAYRRALQIVEQTYGTKSEYATGLTSALGDVLFAQNNFAAAQSEYMHSLDALGNAEKPDLEMFCTILEKMAHCCAEQKDFQRANAYYRHFFKTKQTLGTDRSAEMADTLERHAAVLDEMGQRDEAGVARQRAQTLRYQSQ